MDDLLSEFLTETAENLSVLDVELVRLEQNPNDPELLSNIFRLVHTIKGTCGFLGLPRLESVAHAAENILGKFRDGELQVTPDAVTLILRSLDTIKSIVSVLEETEQEPAGDDSELIQKLDAMAEGKSVDPSASASPPSDSSQASTRAAADDPDDAADAAMIAAAENPGHTQNIEGSSSARGQEPDEFGFVPVPAGASGKAASESQATTEQKASAADNSQNDTQAAEKAASLPSAKKEEPAKAAPPALTNGAAAAQNANEGAARESSVANQSIRVHVDLLENLMTMVSELVLTRNQLLQILRSHKDSEFVTPLQRLNHVTSELQEGVMKTRMQPIGNAWAKLPRIIRDLSQELHKKIELQMVGAETELDRQVLDLIKDPLTHMVRNSADHGIEMPEDRVKNGKAETGKIKLNAYHEGGHIIIEISDDGRGLNLDKIKDKALQNGLTTEAELAGMSDLQIQQFIFKPGFSTASQVTNVSGRGVGMDVVRNNIEKIGGTIELKSEEGRGSTFLIKIPLTLAIVSALIVACAGERFAVPQISVVELVRTGGQSEHSLETINGTPVLRLRNRLLPLVNLQELLQLPDPVPAADARHPAPSGPKNDQQPGKETAGQEVQDAKRPSASVALAEEKARDDHFIIVTQVGNYTFGIIVDKVFDTEEIVVKPVAPIIRHIEMFSGNTILGDGSVIMILDPNGIASSTGEISVSQDHEEHIDISRHTKVEDKTALLLFRAGGSAPKAVPLALVARLEDIALSDVETANDMLMVQYRGHLMPLVPFDNRFSLQEQMEKYKHKPILVFADGDRSMGLVVDEIIDIVEEKLEIELTADNRGSLGSAIIAKKATDIIDTGFYLTQAYHDWFGSQREALEEKKEHRILLIDDSPFFRNMMTPLLNVAGYQVVAVNNADEALNLCDSGEDFDAIVSDIEMPGMNGFDFVARIRQQDSKWAEKPVVALSSHTTAHDLERGRKAGFTDYVAKFDRDGLLNTLSQTLNDMKGAA